jgi:hypothetical protein
VSLSLSYTFTIFPPVVKAVKLRTNTWAARWPQRLVMDHRRAGIFPFTILLSA